MYQKNLVYRHNGAFKDYAARLRDSILRDEAFVAFANERHPEARGRITNPQMIGVMGEFADEQTDPVLKEKFKLLADVLRDLNVIAEINFGQNPPSAGEGKVTMNTAGTISYFNRWAKAVSGINRLNGYDTDPANFAVPFSQDVVKKEDMDLTGYIHQAYADGGYAQLAGGNPEGKLALHLGQLCGGLMSQLAAIEAKNRIDDFAADYLPKSGDKQKKEVWLMQDLATKQLNYPLQNGVTIFDLVTDDEKHAAWEKDLAEKRKEAQNAASITDEELRKAVAASPKTKRLLEERRAAVEEQTRKTFPSNVEAEAQAVRSRLEQEAQDRAEDNKEIEADNVRIREENARVNAQIEEIRKTLNGDLNELNKQDRELFRAKTIRDWSNRYNELANALPPLQDRKNSIVSRLVALRDGIAGNMRLEMKENIPPESHFEQMEDTRHLTDDLDNAAGRLFQIGGNVRGAQYLNELVNEKDVKAYRALEAEAAKQEAAVKELTAKGDMARLPEAVSKLQQVKMELSGKNQLGQVLGVLDELKTKHPETYAELEKRKAAAVKNGTWHVSKDGAPAVTEYTVLNDLLDEQMKHLRDLREEQKEYYDAVAAGQRADEMLKENPNLMKELNDQLIEVQGQIDALGTVPTREEVDRKLAEDLKKLPPMAEIKAKRKELRAEADKKIKTLREQLREEEPLHHVLDAKEIDEFVEKERSTAQHVYEVHVYSRVKETMALESEKIITNSMKQFRDEQAETGRKVFQDIMMINGFRERAKENYKNAEVVAKNRKNLDEVWSAVEAEKGGYVAEIERGLKAFAENADKGTKEGHKNTAEFNAMKQSVVDAAAWVKEHRDSLKARDGQALKDLREKLTAVDAAAERYQRKKQKGIHWRPSNMRFVRLQYAGDLREFITKTNAELREQESIDAKRAAMANRVRTAKAMPARWNEFPDFKSYMRDCRTLYGPKAAVPEAGAQGVNPQPNPEQPQAQNAEPVPVGPNA